ncbi:CPII coat sec24 protein, partial [Schizopora paradoxa]
MASNNNQLPPGWTAEWNPENQCYLFIETATGHSQWEPPATSQAPSPPPPVSHAGGGGGGLQSKRRQYAAKAAYNDDYTDNSGYMSGLQQPPAPQQLFTPGLAGSGQFASQQNQQPHYPQPDYINGPAYQQQQQMGAMTDQFSQMGVNQGQRPYALHTTNLMDKPPDPRELLRPPPEIRLPSNACISDSPFANADPSYHRCTINAIPTTSALLSKSKLPFALVSTPYRSLKEGDPPVPLITDTVIARCRRCRSYINPFVQFVDGGNRWRCTICNMSNEVPQMFDWDQERNQAGNRWARAELNHSVVEYVAPTEYMVRPPQPVFYCFLIDVSHAAVSSGMVATACRTLLESLDRIPNDDKRTKVAIICFDVALHFFSMTPGSTESSMLVVSDLDDVFMPKPTDLLVNLTEARTQIEGLLGRIGDMFQDSHTIGSALGPAMQAGYKLISAVGGKLIVLSASLPSLGEGSLKNRVDPKILGTSKESSLLQPASSFYKTFAIDCSRSQVSVDMFLTSATYQDVATLACLPHYTSGQTYFYPAFNASKPEDAIKFAHEFGEVIAMPIMVEAVMRVRATKGLRLSSFHGNFFVRSTDLLAMPAVPNDQSYAIEIQIEDTITSPFVLMQTAILHSTCTGERRIRVITLALPTTTNLSEVYASADQIAIATYLANKAVERSLSHKLEDAREALVNKMVEVLGAYKSTMTAAGSGASAQLSFCDNMRMLPLLILGLLKNVGVRQSSHIQPDLRAYAHCLLTTLPAQLLVPYIHPNFYSLHDMPQECGTVGEHGIIMPEPLPLSSERLVRHGLFLIDDGQSMFLWVGQDAVPQLIMDVFDLPSFEALRNGKATLPLLENPFSQRVNAVIAKTREMRRGPYYPHLYVVKQDAPGELRLWALSCLIQDRSDIIWSYPQFVDHLKGKVNGTSY